jgi:hypothetical protein
MLLGGGIHVSVDDGVMWGLDVSINNSVMANNGAGLSVNSDRAHDLEHIARSGD